MDDERKEFSQSWCKSVNECSRLVNYIIEGTDGLGLPPHKVKDTLSINDARRLIVGLSQPIADIANNIEATLKKLSQHEEDIINFDGTIDDLKSLLYIPELDIEIKPIDAFFPVFSLVKKGYHTLSHIFTYYTPTAVERRKGLNAELKTKEDAKKAIENVVKALQEKSKEYIEEKDTITIASAKFAIFLKNNAIAPYNDSFKEYLELLIEKERCSSIEESIKKEKIDGLQKIIDQYEKEKKALEEAIDLGNKENCDVSQKHIYGIINGLYGLKIYGEKIRELHNAQEKGKMTDEREKEVIHDVSDKKRGIFGKFWKKLTH